MGVIILLIAALAAIVVWWLSKQRLMAKPWLEEGRVRVAGEITPEALDLHGSRNVGFFASLNKVRVEPFTAKRTVEVLEQSRLSGVRRYGPIAPRLRTRCVPGWDPLRPASALVGKASTPPITRSWIAKATPLRSPRRSIPSTGTS